jgi:hypothetical protein
MPEFGKPDKPFAKRGRVEMQDYCTEWIGSRYAARDRKDREVFGGLTARRIGKQAQLRASHRRTEGFESLNFRMAFQDPVDGRITFDPPLAHESETDGGFGQPRVQERLPYAASQFRERFFLAGSERMVHGDTHGYANIG